MTKRMRLVVTAIVAMALIGGAAVWWQGRQENERKHFDKLVQAAQMAAKSGPGGAAACEAVLKQLSPVLETREGVPEEGGAERGWRAVGDCAMQLQRWPEAISAYRRIVTALPQQSRAHGDLARALSKAGQHAEAVRAAQLSVQLAPDAWQSHRVLGTTLAAAGNTGAAVSAIEKARDLAPPDQRGLAEKYLADLRGRLALAPAAAQPEKP